MLYMVHLTMEWNVRWGTKAGKRSSPVQSPCWSSLYWGVEYRSRHTGPFSVVTKSKDVPFGVGTACGSHRSGLLIICGSQGRRTAQPPAPQRQTGSCLWLMKWLNTGKLFYLNRFAFLLDLWPWQLHCSHSGFEGQRTGFHFSHFTLLDEPDSCRLINCCKYFLFLLFIAVIFTFFWGGEI